MKSKYLAVTLVLLFFSIFMLGWACRDDYIDGRGAVKAAEKFIGEKYSHAVASSVRPYSAFLVDRVWVVKGYYRRQENHIGGPLEIYVSALNGEVLFHVNNK